MIMIEMMQKILMMYTHEGKSYREISRITGVHRETVGKYIRQYEERREQLLKEGNSSVDIQSLIDALTTAPKYNVGVRPKRKITDEIIEKIKTHLEENEAKRNRGQKKQQKKAIDIFEALEAEGINISYSTVRRTIRSLERKVKEAYIKALYAPGQICEFDWGEVKLRINGKLQTFQMALFTTAYGNYRMAYLFTKQTTECFQEAHALFFQHLKGNHQTMVYDNMKVAVKRFVGTEKEPTKALLQLSIYYGFQYRLCNIRRGNEKGHVERSVEVIRRKAFAFRDEFSSLAEANQYLQEVCQLQNSKTQSEHGQTAIQRLEEEHSFLLPYLPPFDAARVTYGRVDKYSTITIDQNRYSVPDHLVGELLMIKVYSTRVYCFLHEKQVAEHDRLTGCQEWRLDLNHYLETLKKKPGALAGSTALHQAPKKIKNLYETYFIKREKEFIQLLQYIRDTATFAEVEQAIATLKAIHPSHVTTDKVKILCAKNRDMTVVQTPVSKTAQEIAERSLEHLRMYDDMFHTHLIKSKEDNVHEPFATKSMERSYTGV
ncbi:IS21 family transposase [Heliorestis acidaminivorans]|uniref:IS21 family transposase n=1 Tax=Heliorestis acidaminivorans TaxID=553427 RepID=A0A6I0ENV4_9FIRM|nr:IS21 family transposase [Heliorestis acidaminivorans]KAB2951501.1 IS21 family transposase [Heliorestis acidaminivorans]